MDSRRATRNQGSVLQGRTRSLGLLGSAMWLGWLSHPWVTPGHPHGHPAGQPMGSAGPHPWRWRGFQLRSGGGARNTRYRWITDGGLL